MESPRELSFRARSIGTQLTAHDTAEGLLAHGLWHLLGRLRTKRTNKQPMVQTSQPLAVATGVPTTIGVAPVLLMLPRKMAKRPRQVKHQLGTLLRPPNRAVLSDTGSLGTFTTSRVT